MSYRSVILIESKSQTRYICPTVSVLFLCFPLLRYVFASFTFSFLHHLPTSEKTIFWVIENIFHSGLDGTMTCNTVCFVTNCNYTNYYNFSNHEMGEKCMHIAPLIQISLAIKSTGQMGISSDGDESRGNVTPVESAFGREGCLVYGGGVSLGCLLFLSCTVITQRTHP